MNQGWHLPPGSFEAHWYNEDGLALCGAGRRSDKVSVINTPDVKDDTWDCKNCWRTLQYLKKCDDDVKQGALA